MLRRGGRSGRRSYRSSYRSRRSYSYSRSRYYSYSYRSYSYGRTYSRTRGNRGGRSTYRYKKFQQINVFFKSIYFLFFFSLLLMTFTYY